MSSGKQYGLLVPKKATPKPVVRPSVFGNDSDSDKSDSSDWLRKASKTDFTNSIAKRQAKVEIEKALKEDATVFLYDELYDEIEQKKQSTVSAKEKEKKPKYIEKLMVAAEKRKVENERRYERQVQKEREAEGDEFKDKETFVTSAYKKKLEEFAKLDAEQKRMDMLEDIGDVTKQQDMSGFYRHLYHQTVDEKKEAEDTEKKSSKEKTADDKKAPNRQYRKRKDSDSSVDKDQDADSNLVSSSSSSESSDTEESGRSSHSDTEDPKRIRLKKYTEEPTEKPTVPKQEPKLEKVKAEVKELKKEVKEVKKEVKKEKPPPPPPVDIWKKRTVGPVFDAALQRYLERKTARLAMST